MTFPSLFKLAIMTVYIPNLQRKRKREPKKFWAKKSLNTGSRAMEALSGIWVWSVDMKTRVTLDPWRKALVSVAPWPCDNLSEGPWWPVMDCKRVVELSGARECILMPLCGTSIIHLVVVWPVLRAASFENRDVLTMIIWGTESICFSHGIQSLLDLKFK